MEHRHHKPHPGPCPVKPCCPIEDTIMEKVSRRFATNEALADLATDVRKVNDKINIKSEEAACKAARIVIRQVRPDLERLDSKIDSSMFGIEIADRDSAGHPNVQHPVRNIIYLTVAEHAEMDNQWDEWIAVPSGGSFVWEHVGAKQIDLSWIHDNFDHINEEICKLNCKLNKLSKDVAKAIVDRAVKPLNELQRYIHSQEFLDLVAQGLDIPSISPVTADHDGLMTTALYSLLMRLSVWATNDMDTIGGGEITADYVNSLF